MKLMRKVEKARVAYEKAMDEVYAELERDDNEQTV